MNFEHVNFGYEEGQTVLENLNLHVRAGERIALVGPTGAGKIHGGQPALPVLQPARAARSC